MKVLRATGTVFIAVGLSILFFVMYELVGTSAITKGHQSRLQAEFDQSLREPNTLPTPFQGNLPIPSEEPQGRGIHGIARLEIPRIGVNVIVVQGVTLSALAYGPGHYPQTKMFGQNGVAAVAGHRTGWSAPFFNFDKLRVGDEVTVETKVARYTYRITRTVVVTPDHSEVLAGNPESKAAQQLVLTTCTPKFTAKNRLIIFTDLVGTVART